MKLFFSNRTSATGTKGFTLIEMLVVIAIIAILAGIIIPLTGVISIKKKQARARVEVNALDLSINMYKQKRGYFPPDNPNLPGGAYTNQLFYELWGTTTQSGNPPIRLFTNSYNANDVITNTTLMIFFGAQGIQNSSSDPGEIYNYVSTLRDDRIQKITNFSTQTYAYVFASQVDGPTNFQPISANSLKPINAIGYVSSNPTNNPNGFDLWVDILVGGKTNRISNWSKDPIVL